MSIEQIYEHLSPEKKMELAQRLQLSSQDPSTVGTDAEHVRLEGELGDALLSRYSDEALKDRFARLTPDEQRGLELLSAVTQDDEHRMFVQEAERMLYGLSKEDGSSYQLVAQLERQGLLFILPQGWSEVIAIPDEVRQFTLAQLLDRLHGELGSPGLTAEREAEVQTVENCGLSLYHDILTLASAFSRDVIPITQKGHVYKREMKPLLAKLRTKEHRFPDTMGEPIPRNYFFLEAFLKFHQIVSFERSYAVVNQNALNQLLRAPYIAWADLIYQFYLRRVYVGRIFPRSFLIDLISRLGRDGWVSADALFLRIEQFLAGWGMTITRTQLSSVCYHPFTLLGLIEWGEDVTGHSYFRWTNWGRAFFSPNDFNSQLSDEIYVQPNLEVIVPEQVLPAIRWSVEAFAELQQADTAFIYKFTRDRLLLALEAGWSVSDIADFLKSFSKIPVSDNIVPTLEGWIGNYGQAVLWDVMVLKVESDTLASRLRKDRGFAKWIVTSFSEDTFVIHRKDEHQVRAWLEDLGITVPLKVHGTVKVAEENVPAGKLSWIEEEKNRQLDALLLYNLSALSPVAMAYLTKSEVAKVKQIERESFADQAFSL